MLSEAIVVPFDISVTRLPLARRFGFGTDVVAFGICPNSEDDTSADDRQTEQGEGQVITLHLCVSSSDQHPCTPRGNETCEALQADE